MERRLAAILAADVVGYSRLMEADEETTIRALSACRQVIDELVASHHGRVFGSAGDSVIAEFGSAVEAVHCAVEIQRHQEARDADLSEDRRMRLRIGINLGDIVVDGDNMLGDGVNIAARLETLADPGGITLAQSVYDQVRKQPGLDCEYLGEHGVKNIAEPIRVYRVATEAGPEKIKRAPKFSKPKILTALVAMLILVTGAAMWLQRSGLTVDPALVENMAYPLPDKPSIAVLPFDNMSTDPEQEYFADGMTEDLITDLAKISGLLVIARNSTFAYKGQSPDVREVARALGARYVVEGSVRKAGGRIRINAQLIDAETGTHLWAERYDREAKNVFELQDDVRVQIVAALQVELTPDEETRLAQRLTTSSEAYDYYMRGMQQESFFTKEGSEESLRLFEKALELDPIFAAAMGRLATAHTLAAERGWSPSPEQSMETARLLAEKAVALNDDLPQAHWAMARVYSREWLFDGERAVASLRKAIALDPNYADGYAFLATILILVGQGEEALGHIETAMRLNPRFPFWYYYALGASQFMLTRYDAAVESLEKAIERNSAWPPPHRILVAAYGHLEMIDEAEWEMEELRALGFEPTIANWISRLTIQDPAYLERYIEGLRKAGVPEE